MTARHQAVAQRQQTAPHSRHGQQAGSSSSKPHTQPTKDEQPRLSAFKFEEEEEEEGLRAGRAKAGQRKEASEGRGRGAKVEKQEEEDGDFDALMERLLSGQKDARAGKAAALSSGAVPGSPVLELLPFPLAPSPPPRAAGGAGEALLLHDRPGEEPPLLTSSSSSALPYGEALVKSVTRGGEEAFYRLSAILRSSDDTSNGTPFLPYTRVRWVPCLPHRPLLSPTFSFRSSWTERT